MNAVTQTTGNAVGALKSLKTGLANVRQSIPQSGGNPFLRMLKDGSWVYGADDIEVHPDQVFAINPLGIQHGWIAWKEREQGSKEEAKVLGERMVPMTAPKPLENELPHVEEGKWTNQIDLPMKGVGGDDAGVEVNFKSNSIGGLNEAARLIDSIMAQLDIDEQNVVPLVKLSNDHYKHKMYGKVYTPVFEIVGWTNIDVPEASAPATPVKEAEVTRVETTIMPAASGSTEEEGPAPAEAGTRRRRRPAA